MAINLPLVSVILPIRNGARDIQRCLDAVLGQDYPAERLEVLVADGRSTDGTREAVAEYAACHPRLRLLDNPGGSAPTGLNVGIDAAQGDYIVRVDVRTEIAPDYVRTCVEYLQWGVECVGGPMRAVGEGFWGRTIALVHGSRFGLGGGRFHLEMAREEEVDTVYLGAFPRSLFDRTGRFNERLVRNQDLEFLYRIRQVGGRVLLAPRIRSVYHTRRSLGAFLQQNYQNGIWNVGLLTIAPGALSLRHFVPLFFILALVGSLLLSPWLLIGRVLLGAVLLPYLLLDLGFSLDLARAHGWRYFPALLATFPLLHITYGLGYLAGFSRFGVPPALFRPSTFLELLRLRKSH